MKNFIIILFLFIPTICFAENKIFFDSNKKLEVCDVSGLKTTEQINKEFNGNFTDITKQRNEKIEANKLLEKEKSKQKDIEKKQKEDSIKQKLNLSDKDLQDLKEILK